MAIISISDVAEHNFKSLEEIERYIQEVKLSVDEADQLLRQFEAQFGRTAATAAGVEFKIDLKKGGTTIKKVGTKGILVNVYKKIVIPKMDTLRKNFSIVDELSDKLDILRSLESTVALHFKSKVGSGKTLEGIKRLRGQIEIKVKNALAFLQKVAQKHAPEPFTEFVQKTMDQLADEITFTSAANELYVSESVQGQFEFTHYVLVKGLTDDEGKAYPLVYIVFTCVLEPLNKKDVDINYYVNLLHDFSVPSKFDKGTKVDSVKGALMTLGSMLELENFSNTLGTIPMNLDSKKITKNTFSVRDFITSVEIDQHSISFILAKGVKTQEQINKLTEQLYVELKALLNHIKAKLKVRVVKELNKYKVTFYLTNVANSEQISVDDVEFLQEKFGLNDEKLRRVVRIINGG